MSDNNAQVVPTPPLRGAEPAQPVRRPERPADTPRDPTGDVVVRIRDAAIDRVLSELPSKEVQAVTAYLKNYLETMSRHRAALQAGSCAPQ
jgi:hypothetical protein